MKKKISSLLVFTLVLTLLVPAFAFAAVPSDVKGSNYEEAVAKLVALGVVNGYPDGTFRADQPINRAEFAKIVAYASGFAKAAELLGPQNTQFKDVNANSYGWASGYIAVGASKGYFKGYNDGTFRPAKQVTYAEVLTVLLRVLGYNDNLIGSWPSDYIIQATTLGITDGVTVTSNGFATRGAVAQLTSATLDQNLVYYDKDLGDFTEVKKDSESVKLLSKAFESSLQTAVVYKPTLGGDNKDQVSLRFKVTDKDGKVSYEIKNYTAKDLYISGGKTLSQLLGHNVEVLVSGSNIKFINDTQKTEDVVTGDVSKTTTGDVYKVTVGDTDYTLDSQAVVYYNDELKEGELTASLVGDLKDATVTLFKQDGKVRFVVATEFTYSNLVVTDLSTQTTSGNASITADVYKNSSITVRIDKDTKFFLDGKEAKYSDLAKGNIINVIGTSPVKTLYAYSANFKGIPSKVNVTKKVVTVDSKDYELAGYAANAVNDIKVDGKAEYTFYLNGKGQVAYFKSVTGAAAEVYGFLAKKDNYNIIENGRTGKAVLDLIVVNSEGKVVTLRAKSTSESFTEGSFYKFVEKDGTYAKADAEEYTFNDFGTVKKVGSNYISTDSEGNSKTYLKPSVVIFDISGYKTDDRDAADVKVVGKDALSNSTVKVHYAGGYDSYIDYILITKAGQPDAAQLSPLAGVVTGKETVADANGTTYNLYLDNDSVAKAVYSGLYNSVNKFDLVYLKDTNASDKYGQYDTNEVVSIVKDATVSDLDTSKGEFKLGGTEKYLYNSATVFYLVDNDNSDDKTSVSFGVAADLADAKAKGYKVSIVKGAKLDSSGVYEVIAVAIYANFSAK